MRSSSTLRLGAALTSAALAVALGTGPASAAEHTSTPTTRATTDDVPKDRASARPATGADFAGDTTVSRSAAKVAATAATAATANITKIAARSTLIGTLSENYIDVDLTFSAATDVESIDGVKLDLVVDGTKTRDLDVYVDDDGIFFVAIPDSVGLGRARFFSATVSYAEESNLAPTTDGTDSNSFYVRREVTYGEISYQVLPASKKSFYLEYVQVYSPAIHEDRPLTSIKLQYYSGGEWRTKKTIALDSTGSAMYTFQKSTKYTYRIIKPRTATFEGINLKTPKI